MGLGRASFYNTFGSKRDVFLKSLDLYFATMEGHLAALIAIAGDSRAAVAARIDGVLTLHEAPNVAVAGWRGCLIGNTAPELGASDEEIVDPLWAWTCFASSSRRRFRCRRPTSGAQPVQFFRNGCDDFLRPCRIHLTTTLLTAMPVGAIKIAPMKLYSIVEILVGRVLIIGALALPNPVAGRRRPVVLGRHWNPDFSGLDVVRLSLY